MPTSADVVAILDRIVSRIARRLADEARDEAVDEEVEVLMQVQAEAAATWRSPGDGKPTVRGVEPGSSAAACRSTFSSLPCLTRASRSNRPGPEFVSLVNEAIAH